ncbi:MAG: HipA domain-containing protein [Chthonomonas sp.]|nr:HipA domain-containing protein [Chthonomonas sp.]
MPDAIIYQGDDARAEITRDDNGLILEYLTPGPPLAAQLPYFEGPRSFAEFPNFLINLLPEGARLQMLLDALRAKDDALELLLRVGWDTIGDVAVLDPDASGPRQPLVPEQMARDVSFWKLFEAGAGEHADASVPGVQEKLSAATISFGVRMSDQLSAILKLNPRRYPRLVYNEHFFLRMAKGCGLEVAAAQLVHDREREPGLLVTRFDRVKDGRTLRKLHQEDGCQILDLPPRDKYQVSVRHMADALVEFASAPRAEVLRLLEQVLFNYIIGNADQHAKNVSLLWRDGVVRLSPAYDVLSTLPYALPPEMSMHLDGKSNKLRAADFVKFGERYHVPAKATEAMLARVTTKAQPWIERVGEIGFDETITKKLQREIAARLGGL